MNIKEVKIKVREDQLPGAIELCQDQDYLSKFLLRLQKECPDEFKNVDKIRINLEVQNA